MGLGASEFQEKISQRKDVFPAFCQCRNPQSELIEPVEQVFPEASFSDGFFQILIGGGNQPDIKRVFFRGTYRLAAFLLQGPEQEHLCLIGKVAYLVQKQCPSVNGTEQSDLVAFRTGKGSLLMTEKLGGGKLIGNGPAVDSQIRLVLPMAPGMYLGRNVLLPGAGSPTEQNGDVGTGNHLYQTVHLMGFGAFTSVELLFVIVFIQYLRYQSQEIVWLHRLTQVVDGSQLHGCHRILHLSVVGHDQKRDRVVLLIHPFQERGAISVRQAQVCQY